MVVNSFYIFKTWMFCSYLLVRKRFAIEFWKNTIWK
jgi:hypothetical protein